MKAWVTKHALNTGIREVDDGEMVGTDMLRYGKSSYAYGKYCEWHRTHEGALARAEEMRLKKIASMKKRLGELEAMKFS